MGLVGTGFSRSIARLQGMIVVLKLGDVTCGLCCGFAGWVHSTRAREREGRLSKDGSCMFGSVSHMNIALLILCWDLTCALNRDREVDCSESCTCTPDPGIDGYRAVLRTWKFFAGETWAEHKCPYYCRRVRR